MTGQAGSAQHARRHRGLWWLLGAAVAAWAGSWRLIYLEVTRWHHMSPRLRFTPPATPAGAPPAHAGAPVITALGVAAAAPLLTILVATILLAKSRTRRSRETNPGR